jgi:hypothetical protein
VYLRIMNTAMKPASRLIPNESVSFSLADSYPPRFRLAINSIPSISSSRGVALTAYPAFGQWS